MRIGVSTYCFNSLLSKQAMGIMDVLDWVSENGGEHVEIVPSHSWLGEDLEVVDAVRGRAEALGLDLTNYSVPGNFLVEPERLEDRIESMKAQVDIAARFGVKRMRHDVTEWAYKNPSIIQFDKDLPIFVHACRQIADYAAGYGITTSIENHGFYVTMSERVLRLVQTVDRPNFKVTLDIGNFLCVDENPLSAMKRCLPYASIVHFKDFYIRSASRYPGDGWLQTLAGHYIRGSIIGEGDVEVREIAAYLKQSGYNGDITIEFEGWEESKFGVKRCLENVKRIWSEA